MENIPSSQEKSSSESDPRSKIRDYITRIYNPANELGGWHKRPIDLTREQRKEYMHGTPEQQQLAADYEKSKFRGNWFTTVFGILEDLDYFLPELKDNPKLQELKKEEKELKNEFESVGTFHGNKIPGKMVDQADDLLKKALDLLD